MIYMVLMPIYKNINTDTADVNKFVVWNYNMNIKAA
jgi:hypothetical protein